MTSPLERLALLAILSLMRDSEPDGMSLLDPLAERNMVPLRAVYDKCCRLEPHKSYEIQRRNQRQSLRRALGRLHEQGWINAIALGWCDVSTADWIEWHGGGKRERQSSGYAVRFGVKTPNWKMVGLNDSGIRLALALEREGEQATGPAQGGAR